MPTVGTLNDISCPNAAVCVAVGENAAYTAGAAVVTTNGGSTWTSITTLPASVYQLNSVSCTSVTVCVAAGMSTDSEPYDLPLYVIDPLTGTTTAANSNTTGAISVFCALGGGPNAPCVALLQSQGSYTDLITTSTGGTSWSSPFVLSVSGYPGTEWQDFFCYPPGGSDTDCVADGYVGGGTNSYQAMASTTDLFGSATTFTVSSSATTVEIGPMSCSGQTTCIGADEQWYTEFYGPTEAAALTPPDYGWITQANQDSNDVLIGLDCVSPTTCVAVGEGFNGPGAMAWTTTFSSAYTGNGQGTPLTWVPQSVPSDADVFYDVSCPPGGGSCFAAGELVDGLGEVVVDTSGVNGPPPVPAGYLAGGAPCPCADGSGVVAPTGDFYTTSTDASARTYGPPLDFSRTYDALVAQQDASGAPGPLGFGWVGDDLSSLSVNQATGAVTVVGPTGGQTEFDEPGSGGCPQPYERDPSPSFAAGSYCAASYVTATLTYDSTAQTYELLTHPYEEDIFNSAGRLTSVTDADGEVETLSYPAGGGTDCPSDGGTVQSCIVVMAASGRMIVAELTETQPSGSSLYPLYQVTSVVDPLGRSWTYSYCTAKSSTCLPGDLVSVSDPLGRMTSFEYDSGNSNSTLQHDLTIVLGPNAQRGGPDAGDGFDVSYDSAGRASVETDPMGRETSFNYSGIASGTGDVVVTDADGFETNDTFVGNVPTSTTSDYQGSAPATTTEGPNWSTLEDVQTVDADQEPSSYGYDGDGNTTSATSPLAEATSSYNNSSDEPLCSSTPLAADPNGVYPTDVCASLSAAGSLFSTPVPAGQSFSAAPTTDPPSNDPQPPPVGVTYDQYDSNGDLVWSETGVFAPNATTASAERVEYTLYSGESVQPNGFSSAVSCSTQPPASDLACATINPVGTVTQYAYDAAGDLTSETVVNANGSANAVTTHTYDGDGELISTTSPLGNASGADAALYTTTTSYDGAGEAVATITGLPGTVLGSATATAYDANGNATSRQNALFETDTTAYNADDEASLVTDADGHSTLTCFDGLGRVITTVPPDGVGSLTPSSCRTSAPWGLATPPPDATTTAYGFSALFGGASVLTTSPSPAGQSGGETTTQYYDPAGDLAATVSPPLGVSSGYDAASVTTYDADGRPLAVTNGLEWNTSTQVFSTTGATTTAASCYDAAGRRTATVPGDGNTSTTVSSAGVISGFTTCTSGTTSSPYATSYTYDSVGDELTVARPVTQTSTATWNYAYNADGALSSAGTPAGTTTDTYYDASGEVVSVTYEHEPVISYSYDIGGERTSMRDAGSQSGSESAYEYDPAGLLASVTNEAGQTTSYGYDASGRVGAISYPLPTSASWAASDTVNYGYDGAGLLTQMTDFAGQTVSITNDDNGLPTQLNLPTTTPESVTTSYDPTAAADDIVLVPTADVGQSADYQLEFGYSDKPPGEVATETDTPAAGCVRSYEYNAAAEVTRFGPSTCQLTYSYDASGNPTTLPNGTSAVYKVGSELCWSGSGSGGCSSPPSGAISYSYDADEDLTGESGGATASATWYTLFDQLTSYTDAAANMTSATYDGDGLRISDAFGSTTQDFAWDEISSSVPRLLVDGTNAYLYADGETPIEQVALSTGSASYLVADKLGSVRGVVASSGSLVASTAYDPWGNPSSSGGLTSSTPFGFAGGYTDPTGLVYLQARYYSPTNGQFLSLDRAVDTTGQPYAYAGNDPVVNTDPNGLDWEGGSGDDDGEVAAEDALVLDIGYAAFEANEAPLAVVDPSSRLADAQQMEQDAQIAAQAQADAETQALGYNQVSQEDRALAAEAGSRAAEEANAFRDAVGSPQSFDRSLGNSPGLNPPGYLNGIASQAGINLRGVQIIYDETLPAGVYGRTLASEGGWAIRVGPDAISAGDSEVANTIAHELSHARYLQANGSFAGEIHGDASSFADVTPYGSGNACQAWWEGNC